MTGKEPAAIDVIDLTQCEDGDDVNCASTSAATFEIRPFLILLASMVQPEIDGTCSRAAMISMLQQFHEQAWRMYQVGHVETQPLLRPAASMVQLDDGTSSRAPQVGVMQQAQGQRPVHDETKPLVLRQVAPTEQLYGGTSSRATVGDMLQQPQPGQTPHLPRGHAESQPLLWSAPIPVQLHHGSSSRAPFVHMMQQAWGHSPHLPRGHVETQPRLRTVTPMLAHAAHGTCSPATLSDMLRPPFGHEPQRRYGNFALPRRIAPKVQPHNGTPNRATPVDSMQQAHGQRRQWLRGQRYALHHPERLSTPSISRGNGGEIRSCKGISDDHCQAYLAEQDGGISEAPQRPQAGQVTSQPSVLVELGDSIPDMQPEQSFVQESLSSQAKVTLEQMSQTAAHHQADAKLNQVRPTQMEEARRERNLNGDCYQPTVARALSLQEHRDHRDLMVYGEVFFQPNMSQKAPMLQQHTAPSQNNDHNVQRTPHSQVPLPPPHPLPPPPHVPSLPPPHVPPPPPPSVPLPPSLHVPPSTHKRLNWASGQQWQQHVHAGHPPDLMSGGENWPAMNHCGATSQPTMKYVLSTIEQARAFSRKMLAEKERESWPPHKFHRHASGPPLDASLRSQATFRVPQVRTPSAPSHSTQAGPSQASPTGPELSQATKASLKRKGSVCSTDSKEEDNTTTDQPGTSSEPKSPQHDEDANMDTGELYVRVGESGEYVLVEEDVKPALTPAADYIKTTTDHVKRDAEAILKDCSQ